METVKKYLPLATFILVFLVFFKSCGTSSKVSKLEKQNEKLMVMLDSIYSNTAKTSELKPILRTRFYGELLKLKNYLIRTKCQ